ncbi:multidrug and toxin extrusion protein 1-like [Bombina bombina]|uniref:multidrug and toxin extrusion protein 1-like n=1 Tax=Bombina bombina TaxID=8345 RepID=UPI00235A9C3C|nr:multidrug and toxin extrusion protein 1-like [Bombina bombina]
MKLNCSSGCCSTGFKRIQQFFIDNIGELKMLLWFTGPLTLISVLDYTPYVITAIFCGHLGKVELDSITLAHAIAAVTGQSVGLGLTSACDTLISQIYGGKNLKLIGVVIQRGILILFLSCFPCWAIYINTQNILLLCGQEPRVARLAEWCVIVLIPALPAVIFYQLQIRFLQNQGIIWPQIFVSLIGNIVNIILNYIFLFVIKTGVIGAAVTMTITYVADMIFMYLYIWLRKIHVESWSGWSTECLRDWGSFLSLGIPSMVIMCMEWWSFEIAIFLTGLINLVELGAQSVVYQLMVVFLRIANAIGTATSIRVGNFLGAGETDQAKMSAKLSFLITGITICINVSLLLGLRRPFACLFTTDIVIQTLVIQVIPIGVLHHVATAGSYVFCGVLRGIGKPEIGALATVLGYCLITFPIGAPLMFVAKLGIKGFWIGVSVCCVCINIFLFIHFWRINWQDMTDKAQERAGLKPKNKPSSILSASIDTADTVEQKNYASINSTNSETEPHERQSFALLKVKDEQSLKKIIIQRVLTTLAMISIFLIGLIIRLTVNLH